VSRLISPDGSPRRRLLENVARTSIVCGFAFALAACSTATIKPAKPGDEGIPFYRPWPYLLVSLVETESSEPALKSEIVWLPDYSHTYVVQPKRGLGKADLTVDLEDGWMLKSLTLNRDAQAAETIEQLTATLAKILPMMAFREAERGSELKPGLYRIEWGTDSRFVSLTRLELNVGGEEQP
jgi:hypothetical protein